MEKLVIKNRKDLDISVLVEQVQDSKKLAFVMHGLGGFKEQPHIETIASTFRDAGYTVVRFDTTNSFGESGGKYEDATITSMYADLEDVIEWAENEEWYQEPFVLTGHSLGGFCVAYYAQNYSKKVKAVAPISATISGKLSLQAPQYETGLDEWKETGWVESESVSKPGTVKRLPWSHMEDRLTYDLLKNVDKQTMPVLMVVGSEDQATPPEHQKELYDVLPGKKELHIIEGSGHNFRSDEFLGQLKGHFKNWIESL